MALCPGVNPDSVTCPLAGLLKSGQVVTADKKMVKFQQYCFEKVIICFFYING